MLEFRLCLYQSLIIIIVCTTLHVWEITDMLHKRIKILHESGIGIQFTCSIIAMPRDYTWREKDTILESAGLDMLVAM